MSVTRELFDMPPEIAALPRDHRGYPVPKFATWDEATGKWDFVLASQEFMHKAVKERLCWLCGCKMGKRLWFVTGPMCTITGASAEPPCHRGCAIFAVKNCPFMVRPMAKRVDLSKTRNHRDHMEPGGNMITHNPGVMAIYETPDFRVHLDPQGKPVFIMGNPKDITWWREGRPATGDEVFDAIEKGLPKLWEMATGEGPIAVYDMQQLIDTYTNKVLPRFLPKKITSQGRG